MNNVDWVEVLGHKKHALSKTLFPAKHTEETYINPTQQKQTTQEQNSLSLTGEKHKLLLNLNKMTHTNLVCVILFTCKNWSCLCVPLCATVIYSTVFPLILQTIVTAQILSTGGVEKHQQRKTTRCRNMAQNNAVDCVCAKSSSFLHENCLKSSYQI